MERWVVPLDGADGSSGLVGGKAASLARLVAMGLNVPAAVAITVQAYREHLARPAVAARLKEALRPDQQDRPVRLAALRDAVLSEPLATGLSAQVQEALRELGDVPLAVRSSAAAEDSATHSFAGQHETILGVRGLSSCSDAVRRCWASAWSDRAVAYREQAGLPVAAADMAVVLQRLVPAVWAGVLFTVDPSTGRRDRLVCEAVRGLGEVLVSGRVSPWRWVLDRETLAVTERATPTRDVVLVSSGQPVEETALPPAAMLDDDMVTRVARAALAVEEATGVPQDIEWAVAEGEFHVLQARPVTTSRDARPLVVWSNTNLGELLPEVATPMTFSVARRFIDELLGAFVGKLGLDMRTLPIVGLVAGRLYLNMNAVAALFRRMPGMGRRSYADYFGGDQAALRQAMSKLRDEDLPQTDVSPWRVLAHVPGFLLWIGRCLLSGPPPWLADFNRELGELAPRDPRDLTDEEIPDRIEKLMSFMSAPGRSDGMAHALVATGSGQWLVTACRTWLDDTDGSMANRLLSGVGGLDSAEAGLALWRLADLAREHKVVDLVAGAHDFAAMEVTLAQTQNGRAYAALWKEFLARHGHHARGEMDVAIPRWRDQPDHLLSMVRGYLDAPAVTNPVALHQQRAGERARLEAACRRKLGPIRRRVFNGLLSRAQRGVASRESAKSEFVRRAACVRAILLDAGRRLAERGHLRRADDVFYLSLAELPAALRGEMSDLGSLTTTRRADTERFRGFNPPAVIEGDFDPRRQVPPAPLDAQVLRGLSVSPGFVEGRARVILAADTGERVLAGEILVAPFTDPGWTPYFLTAGGIVMDMGGMLSHGAVVAREYGIPAVVNVGPATRCIRTGQLVRVDAFRGEVTILEGGPPP
jgi:pyruvate,water dikinase